MVFEKGSASTRREPRTSVNEITAGMRVLVVDDDPCVLLIAQCMLHHFHYEVTLATEATTALEILRENMKKYDLVICDVHMPGMNGFELLKYIKDEMDLPVVMLSVDHENESIQKAIALGACDYMLKPLRLNDIKIIWRHIIKKDKYSHVANRKGKGKKKRKGQHDEEDSDTDEEEHVNEDSSVQRKSRFTWSSEPHQKFLEALHCLGPKATPKEIHQIMNLKGLKRKHVSSHLQDPEMVSEENEEGDGVPLEQYMAAIPEVQNDMVVEVDIQGAALLPDEDNAMALDAADTQENENAEGNEDVIPVVLPAFGTNIFEDVDDATILGLKDYVRFAHPKDRGERDEIIRSL